MTAPGISLAQGPLEATFLPDLGMLGVSLRHRGDELLALPGGLDGYRAGAVTGLPLLAPWANRLGERRYEVDGVVVDLAGLDLHTDGNGLPIHGTMTAQPGWEVVRADAASLLARFDYGAHPDLLASFPFPHTLEITVSLSSDALSVSTTVAATGDRAVPIAFGYHPYLHLPGVDRSGVSLSLPDRRHLALDPLGLPTGDADDEPAEDLPIGERTFDDHYALGDDRRMALTGGGRRVVLEPGDGYPYGQVFAPPGTEFVCLEPMTAAVNALLDGGYPRATPGSPFTAEFLLRVEDTP
ncbi:MAG TPA: aldose 1-epimerase [Acidimicrobiales bacterium]